MLHSQMEFNMQHRIDGGKCWVYVVGLHEVMCLEKREENIIMIRAALWPCHNYENLKDAVIKLSYGYFPTFSEYAPLKPCSYQE